MAMMRPSDPLDGTLRLSSIMAMATTDALLTDGNARDASRPKMLADTEKGRK